MHCAPPPAQRPPTTAPHPLSIVVRATVDSNVEENAHVAACIVPLATVPPPPVEAQAVPHAHRHRGLVLWREEA
jgi:hypothetical protein